MTDSRVSWPLRFLLGGCALLTAGGLWLVPGVPEDSRGYGEPVREDDAAAQCLAGDGTQAPPDDLGYEAVHKAGVLMGRVPAGATAITAYLPDGGLVQAGTGDGWFVVWAPGAALDGAEVRAVGPDGAVVTSAAAPQEGDPA